MTRPGPLALPALVLLALTLASAAPALAATRIPPGQDEEAQHARREAWIELIHRAAPGTDWRTIEAANRQATRLLLDGRAKAPSSAWSEVGADGQTGRTLVVAASVANSSRLYVGSALGGMWSGDVHGALPWTPLTDALGIGIAQVLVIPRAGHDDFLVSDAGNHLYFTTDGGSSWSVPTGLPSGAWGGRRLLQDPGNPLRVYAMMQNWYLTGSGWEIHDILCASADGGQSFAAVHEEPDAPGCDVWMNRLSGSTIYLLAGRTLMRSVDFGVTFNPRGTLPPGTSDNVRLAASEAGGPKFYATVHDASGWRLYTSNGGIVWKTRGLLTDFGGALDACIGDSAQVFAGGVDCRRSTDGGATFAPINFWYEYYGDPANKLHADIMSVVSLRVPPAGGGPVQEMTYINTDGGTYELGLAAATPVNLTLTGFHNSQYYSVRSSRVNPAVISAGSQDQGYQATTGAPAFAQIISGDYGDLTGSLPTNDIVWSCYPGFLMLQTVESPPALDLPASGSGYPVDSGIQWMPFLLADPEDPSAVLFGARHLWRVKHTAPGTFTTLGALGDFDGGSGDNVGAVAIAPSDHQRWYVATAQGRLWYSANGGATWSLSASAGPGSHYFYGSGLLVSPTNPLVAYACGSGYSNPGVYVTTDGGVTWSPHGSGLPATLVHGLAFDNSASQTVYAATDAGPWRCVAGVWQNLLTTVPGAPLSDYWCVESVSSLGIVRFGTYGRGIWDFHTGATSGVENAPAAGARLAVGPSPSRGPVTLAWSLPAAGRVRIDVFDVTGRRLATPLDAARPAGAGTLAYDGRDAGGRPLRAGIYLVRLESAHGRDVARMLVGH